MTINLSSYKSIQTALFVRMVVPYYKSSPSATPASEVLRFSQYNQPVTINSEVYSPLGGLLSVSDSSSDLRPSSGTFTVAISGIPNTSIAEIINSRIKGSTIQVYRAVFDATTWQLLSISDNPVGRFQGIVNNYSLEEDWNPGATIVSNRIILTCSSTVDVLTGKIAGRRTNPTDEKAFYPSDLAMDRVPTLAESNFNFGIPVQQGPSA